MAFSSSPKCSKRRGAPGFTDINVTPLVDVMLVLLIVFMVTAPMLTVGVSVDLPKTHAAKMNDQVEPIVISVNAEGQSYLQEEALEGEALIARLIAITGSNPDAKIYVRGDQKNSYGRIMEVMGQIAAAGFSKVSLIAEMPMGTKATKSLPSKTAQNQQVVTKTPSKAPLVGPLGFSEGKPMAVAPKKATLPVPKVPNKEGQR